MASGALQDGLKERQPFATDDRRIVFVAITATALDLLTRLDDPMDELHGQLLSHLETGELLELIRLLEKARCPLVAEQVHVVG
jgi:DNA-binding MarR family transcriptional regulator